jgi:hypothetical protein
MANDQVARLLLKYEADQKSLKQAISANASLAKSIEGVGKSNLNLVNTSKAVQAEIDALGRNRQLDAIALSFARGEINAKQLVTALQGLKASQQEIRATVREADRLSDALRRANNAGDDGGTGRQLSNNAISRFGSELRMLPSIQIPGAGIGTDAIANVIRLAGAANQALEGTGASLLEVAAAGSVVAVGISVLIAVLNLFNADLEANKQRAEDFGSALAAAFEAGTTAAIEELRKQKQLELEAAQATKAVLQQRADDAREQLALTMENLSDSIANSMESLSASIFGTDGRQRPLDTDVSVEAYNEQIKEQERIIEAAQIALDAYNVVLGTSTPVTRDAEEAEKELAEARRDAALAAADAAREDQREIGALLRGTAESALNRRAQLEEDARGIEAAIRSLQASGETGEEVDKQLEAYRTELDGVRSDIATITRLLPQVRLQEIIRGAPAAFEKLAKNVAEFNAETERIADTRKLSADRDQLDFIRDRTRALADFERSQAQAEVKQAAREGELRARIAEIDAEADDQAIERTAELNKDLERLAKDHQDRILELTQDGQEAVGDAINARNSQAALRAQRELAKATARENADYEKSKTRREQDFADDEAARKKQADARRAAAEQALADAVSQYAAEKKLRQEEFDIRIARENEDRKLRMERLAEDQRLEDEARQQALNDKQAAILKDAGLNGQFLNNLGATMQTARDTIVGWMTNAVNGMNSIAAQASGVMNSAVQAAKYATANYGAMQSSTGNMSVAVNPSSQAWLQPVYGGGAGGKMTRFAEGGIVPANRAMMGYFEGNRSYPEAVIPLRPHILREIGGGRPSVTVMMNVNRGAVNVTAQPGQDAEAIAVGVVAEFAEKYTPRIMQVIEERIG